MTKRPIIFSGAMVRAILGGRKTQTRRIVGTAAWRKAGCADYAQDISCVDGRWQYADNDGYHDFRQPACPYGVPGDRLWVREAHEFIGDGRMFYKADGEERLMRDPAPYRPRMFRGRPGMHLPHWASRITLEVTGVRIEQVQEISVEDALAEGIDPLPESIGPGIDERTSYAALWDSINAKRASWASNPWVWVIEFRKSA